MDHLSDVLKLQGRWEPAFFAKKERFTRQKIALYPSYKYTQLAVKGKGHQK